MRMLLVRIFQLDTVVMSSTPAPAPWSKLGPAISHSKEAVGLVEKY